MKTDEQLGADVGEELRWTFGGRRPEIAVSVVHGVVTLHGRVADLAGKRAAGEAVERVGGVRAIRNGIGVQLRADASDESPRSYRYGGAQGDAGQRERRTSHVG